MTSSTSFCHKFLPVLLLGFFLCAGCAGPGAKAKVLEPVSTAKYRIAVFPIENLSGTKAPLRELRQTLNKTVEAEGFATISEDALDRFMTRHRIRYIGGIDADSASALAREEGVDGVVISSLECYADRFPPKIALTARLVTARKEPEIVWMESEALSGNDSPGAFDIHLIRDPHELAEKAFTRLAGSLSRSFAAGFRRQADADSGKRSFPPKRWFRADLAPGKEYRLVVLPFYNRSGRKYAGEILALQFVQELLKLTDFTVIEPGVVRHELLQYRVIMEAGVSLANADVIYSVANANMLLTGKVLAYEDAAGGAGVPKVDFSAMMLDKERQATVLSADSYNSGADRVYFFDFGRISTAPGVAAEMVRGIAQLVGQRGGK